MARAGRGRATRSALRPGALPAVAESTGRRKRWRIAVHDPAAVAELARVLDVPPLLASLLIRRGCDTPEAARTFLNAPRSALHDPRLMLGMDTAVDRLRAAV